MRCGLPLIALRTATSQPPPASAVDSATVDGRNSGLPKATSTVSASGSRPDSAASARALTHMPCAIARLNPNAFAASDDMWIGFTSPETLAYRRPASAGIGQAPYPSTIENEPRRFFTMLGTLVRGRV